MPNLLPPWPLFSAFLVASLALALLPGPGVVYVLTRSLAHGRAGGLVSVAGVALGNLGNALAATFGLAALFAASPLAFAVVRIGGALYLIGLGIRALRAAPGASTAAAPAPAGHLFRDGFVLALLNPKTTLFFAAFLPQFVAAGASPALRSALLGGLFVAIAAVTDSLYALAAGVVAPLLADESRRTGRRLSGLVYVALGILALLHGQRARN